MNDGHKSEVQGSLRFSTLAFNLVARDSDTALEGATTAVPQKEVDRFTQEICMNRRNDKRCM